MYVMNLANRITILRIILIPVFIGLILKFRQMPSGTGEAYWMLAVSVFFLAVVSDAVDGYIARAYKQQTKLGTYLDPIADKFLLVSTVIVFSIPSEHFVTLPLWIITSVISRDIIIVMGSLIIYLMTGTLRVEPSFLGKMTTFFQMTMIIWILFMFPHPEYIWRFAGGFTIVSGLGYIYSGSKQFNGSQSHNNEHAK
ncbi:MAG: CDP-alcohol phosphatidyltransferase family protein [Candidatus Ancaeobacter aquaticus]|nr:CDP-alcohol phosphatidyltransferase family protein [Candidatus Ancaeobacter aquaticus]